jgi:flagellar hook-basal body complex protein FliE
MREISLHQRLSDELIRHTKGVKEHTETARDSVGKGSDKGSKSFGEILQDGISNVNEAQKDASKASTELALGKSDSLHETMLSLTKAELSFNLMVQVRNKALEAYQEMMRMQV